MFVFLYLKILTQLTQNLKTILAGTRSLTNTPAFGFRLYFMKGCDTHLLSRTTQTDFLNFVKLDPFANSFLTYNSDYVRQKLLTWQRELPWVTPYYALKSNPIEAIIQDVLQGPWGAFDCASKGEIQLILKHGGQPQRIVYSNSVKNEKDIHYAYSKGVRVTTADSIEELIKIQSIAPKMKILWRISIVEDNPEQLATPFSGKFGDDVTSLEGVEQRFAQIQKLGVSLHGIHFHCGSGQHGSPSFGKAIKLARECMRVGRKYGHAMELLDVGGGFPSGDIHQNALEALKTTKNDPFEVVAEPGRHLSANACQLLFRVMTKRLKSGKLCYHVNESLYHSFNCILMDGVSFEGDQGQFYSAIDAEGREVEMTQGNAALFGMTCDGNDVIASNMRMPIDLKVGDWLCMSGMGAYTVGPKSFFNGMKSTSKVFRWTGEFVEEQSEKRDLQRELA